MRHWMIVLFGLFPTGPMLAQETLQPASLDSGTVVRFHWTDGSEKARLVAPLLRGSALVRYCRYPSSVCGESTINPPRTRPIGDLARLDVRRGSRSGRGALIGAGVGTVGGLLVLLGRGLSDAPRLSTGQQIVTVAAPAATWSVLGALIGAASDNWEPVPPPRP
jgi:hypothetical protein